MISWPESLIREAADRRLLLFVGSGISKAAKSDMPVWSPLIEDLSSRLKTKVAKDTIKGLLRRDKLLDAAEIVFSEVSKPDLTQVLRDRFQVRPVPHHEVYSSILSLDLKTILTTNYDEFLEKNFEHYSAGESAYAIKTHTSDDLVDNLRSPTPAIVKVHGCISDPNKLVLSRTSYFEARRKNPSFFSVLSALFTVNTILFIGYSVSDPDMQMILENIHAVNSSEHPHYALVPKQEHASISASAKRTYNVQFLEYPAGRHSDALEAIMEFCERVKETRAERGIV